MNIEDMNPQTYVDIFGGTDVQKQTQQAAFGSEQVEVDLFGKEKPAAAASTEETTTLDPNAKPEEEREEAGVKGQEYFKSVGAGLSAKEMSNRFIKDMNTAMEKWQPRKRFEIVKM